MVTEFASAVAAHVRAEAAVQRLGLRSLAEATGATSHNYLATRLREEKPLTLDDIARLAPALGTTPERLVSDALAAHRRRTSGN